MTHDILNLLGSLSQIVVSLLVLWPIIKVDLLEKKIREIEQEK